MDFKKRFCSIARSPSVAARTAPLALLFSSLLVWGYFLESNSDIPWNALMPYLAALLLWGMLYVLICLLWTSLANHSPRKAAGTVKVMHLRRFLFISAIILLICWGLTLLAAWPGYYCYDTDHFLGYLSTGYLKNSQPVIHTLLVSNVIRLGEKLLGSFDRGVALYFFMQIAVGISLVVHSLRCLARDGAPRWLLVFSVVFFAMNPAVSMLMCCSTKDTLFSLWLVMFGIILYSCVGSETVGWRDLALLGLFSFLALSWRSNMVVALAVVAIVLFFALRKSRPSRRRILLSLAMGVAMFALWSGPVCSALGVVSSNPLREAISFPSVEIARCQMTDDSIDSDLVSLGVDPNEFSSYYNESHQFTDRLRAVFYGAVEQGRYSELFSLWVKVRMEHPLTCVAADLDLTKAAWCPWALMDGYNEAYSKSMSAFDYDLTETCAFAAVCEPPVEQHSKIPALAGLYWEVSRFDDPATLGPLFVLMSVAPYVWLLLVVLAHCSIVGNRAGKVFCWVLLSVVLTVLLGPMTLLRYYLYVILSLPMLLWLLVSRPAGDGLAVPEPSSDCV
jgi:hypothetical protein